MMMQMKRRSPLRAVALSYARRFCSTPAGEPSSRATATQVTSARSVTPGTVRVRRGHDPRAEEMEMDTTIARIMGSDWGDRSKQPVSYAMKLYWGIFVIVLLNGAYTYYAGKDETYLVDKVQKKVDEKLGRVETDEFVTMADTPKPAPVETEVQNSNSPTQSTQTTSTDTFEAMNEPPASIFASKTTPTPLPFFKSPTPSRPTTKAEYDQQLQQLRQRQACVRDELKDPSSFRTVEDIQLEIKRIDQQKAHIKQLVKKL